jgi:hypothetical protein
MDSLNKILSLYGLGSNEFAKKIEKMLLMAIKFHHPNKSEQEIKSYFNNKDLIWVLNNLIYYSQQFFFARQDERWELLIPAWIEENKSFLFKTCQKTKLCDPVLPTAKEYDAVAVFGANKSEIYRRYKFFYNLLKSGAVKVKNSVYLLTGHRKLTPRIDGSEAYFDYLQQKFGNEIFETQVMIDLYEKFNFADKLGPAVKMKIVDTFEVNNRRPNTYDTLIALREMLDKDDKNILYISRSPAFLEQKAAVDRAFAQSEINYEVVGGSCALFEVKDEARAAYHVLMSIAGALYENYMVVAEMINEEHKLYTSSQLENFKKQLGYRNSSAKEVVFSSKYFTAQK